LDCIPAADRRFSWSAAIMAAATVMLTFNFRAVAATSLDSTVALAVVSQPLKDVVREIAGTAGLGIRIPDTIDTTVYHLRLQGSVSNAMNELAKQYDFVWFADRSTIFVSPTDDQITVAITRPGLNPQIVKAHLQALGVVSEAWRINQIAGDAGIAVSGPSSYVHLVKSMVANMEPAVTPAVVMPLILRGPPSH
jgi:type II secretory pathway component GspD/PulD (secretin)